MTLFMRFDVQARSREFLRRGLFLSGAIHLTLLLAFLNLPGSGGDVLIRSYDRATEIFRQPIAPPILSLPPAIEAGVPSGPNRTGTLVPVEDRVDLPKVHFEGIGASPRPAGTPGMSSGPGSAEGNSGGVPTDDPGRIFLVKDVDVAPVATEQPKPPYPDIAKDQWITGRVVAEVLVQADGSVKLVRILSGNKLLADSVQETLYRWRFRPASVRGRPVAVWVEIPVNFVL